MILQMAGDTQSHYMFQRRHSSPVVADTKQVGFSGKLGFNATHAYAALNVTSL